MKRLHSLTVVAAAALLSACAMIPKLPDAAKPISPEQVGLQSSAKSAELNARWWTEFHDPQLDALIERALAESPNLAAARARIAKANAAAEAAGAKDKPAFEAAYDQQRVRYSATGLYPPPYGGTWLTMANLQVGATYEWDFFGHNKAELAAAVGQGQAAEAEAAAARLMLSSQVARSYLSLARVLAQKEILAQQLASREQALALTHERVVAGLDNRQDLRGAEQPVPELNRQAVVLDEQAALLRHQLAALSVQPAAALQDLTPRMPSALALQLDDNALGIDLLGRRPDVVAARWRVEAATQKVKAARAEFYPNISLSAFAGFNSIGLDNLLKAESRQFGIGPSLRLPLFDQGALDAQLKGAAADTDSAVAAYNNALLEAVRDASDQLATLKSLQGQLHQQQISLGNAESLLNLAETRFNAGLSTRLPVLTAQANVLTQQRQALELRAQALDSQVNLMRALGGGWTDTSNNAK